MHTRLRYFVVFLFLLGVIAAGCTSAAEPISPTPEQTQTPYPTYTPNPTYTPYPTDTPAPTYTPYPTYTPEPTKTATPTAIPTETATPTDTPAPKPTTPPATPTPRIDLRTVIYDTQQRVNRYGGMIDTAMGTGYINCNDVISEYDGLVASPTFDVSGEDQITQNGYAQYRAAIDVFTGGVRDLAQTCRDILADPQNSKGIPPQAWATARVRINETLAPLGNALQTLDSGQ